MKIINKIAYKLYVKTLYSYHYRYKSKKNTLKEYLINNSKRKWLDVGATKSMSEGFSACDLYPPDNLKSSDDFFQWNAIEPLNQTKKKEIGTFDFIRMQHVFEHFTPEDGEKVLKNIFELLADDGIMLITVPDLSKFITMFKKGIIKEPSQFQRWAETRVEKNAPDSFYFSVFTHSLPHQCHLWCYDKDGLDYIIKTSLGDVSTQFLTVWNKRSSIPFTHNRPLEDLCVLITKK